MQRFLLLAPNTFSLSAQALHPTTERSASAFFALKKCHVDTQPDEFIFQSESKTFERVDLLDGFIVIARRVMDYVL